MAKVAETAVNVNEVSRISTGTVIKGEIDSPNDIRIDGSFEGKIVSKGRVVAGDKAVISGDVICENMDFWGKMTGSIYAKDTLTLKEGSMVTGDIHVRRLAVEIGARFEGNCRMLTDGEFEKAVSKVGSSAVAASVSPSKSSTDHAAHSGGGISL